MDVRVIVNVVTDVVDVVVGVFMDGAGTLVTGSNWGWRWSCIVTAVDEDGLIPMLTVEMRTRNDAKHML